MAISEPYELDGVSISTSEISIISGTTTLQTNTTAGIYYLWIDPVQAGMTKGDRFTAKIYEKVEATGGTKRLAAQFVMSHAQSEPIAFPPFILKNGWDMTLIKNAGTDRNWDASIRAVTGSGITEPYELDGVTVGSTELSVVSGTTTLQTVTDDGFYQLWVDASNMAKGDQFTIRAYEKVEGTGGTKRQIYEAVLSDAQSTLFYTPVMGPFINGWDFTIQKDAGTDRAFDASIRRVS